jgi:ABC-2 type transport system permease protein
MDINRMVKLEKYAAVFKIAALHALKNYKAWMGLSLFLITCLLIFSNLWQIVATRAGAHTFSPEHLLWYIAFNEWVFISLPDIQDQMEQDLRTGRLAYLISRPISYLGATFVEAIGVLSMNLLVLGLVTLLFTWGMTGSLPFHPAGLLLTVVFGFLAGCVAVLFQMMIGLSAFWLQEVSPFYWLWEKLLFMFGGLILPLTVYPEWLQKIAYLTPFPAILGGRSALIFDFTLDYALMLAVALIGWGIIGIVGLILIYRRGLRILNIEGG